MYSLLFFLFRYINLEMNFTGFCNFNNNCSPFILKINSFLPIILTKEFSLIHLSVYL